MSTYFCVSYIFVQFQMFCCYNEIKIKLIFPFTCISQPISYPWFADFFYCQWIPFLQDNNHFIS
ncbi:hypothetical protein HOLleu_44307 [Holothuria leucospilota]|uniref:Uncharacterized protein n=1 Tax=Holothuria leucospilota TaxID=206669 RepID=A0A9Q0YAK8_HOLLE|nr:hypothetical protein HOLleu_44307 [Holothuria leucospilota]